MASASKTPNLNLPQWVGTEKPERTDFNAAFDAIDGSVGSPLLTEVVVEEDSTSVEITDLDINTHKSYRIEVETWHNVSGYSSDISMFINNDTTPTNYYSQRMLSRSNTVTSANHNGAIIMGTSREDGLTNFPAIGNISLFLTNGKPIALAHSSQNINQTLININRSWIYKNTVSNITKITLNSDQASGIPAGAKIRIYKGN